MITADQIVRKILGQKRSKKPKAIGSAYAPTNIALVKYWGKRNTVLNLPMTDSFSVSLPGLGATTTLQLREGQDQVSLNGQIVSPQDAFAKRARHFLDLFRVPHALFFEVKTEMNIPPSAGLASSACGFAALVLALDQFFEWKLSVTELSILARLGSGSACRSLWDGFVTWKAGSAEDGMDSFATSSSLSWPDLCLGVMLLSSAQKPISSRIAMERTVQTSHLYSAWPTQVKKDLSRLERSIMDQDFETFGQVVENNALSMHATMISAWPPISYTLPETLQAMQAVWSLRQKGVPIFFTQDAGPNLKVFFLEKDRSKISSELHLDHIVSLFKN